MSHLSKKRGCPSCITYRGSCLACDEIIRCRTTYDVIWLKSRTRRPLPVTASLLGKIGVDAYSDASDVRQEIGVRSSSKSATTLLVTLLPLIIVATPNRIRPSAAVCHHAGNTEYKADGTSCPPLDMWM